MLVLSSGICFCMFGGFLFSHGVPFLHSNGRRVAHGGDFKPALVVGFLAAHEPSATEAAGWPFACAMDGTGFVRFEADDVASAGGGFKAEVGFHFDWRRGF